MGHALAETFPSAPDAVPVRSAKFADLRLRVVSASILAPLALAALWLGGIWWSILIGLIAVGMAWEWTGLMRGHLHEPLGWFGIVYVAAPTLALLWLRMDGAVGRWNVLFLVFVVWASDIGAYAAGRLIGGRRLAPSISPGKTWSGSVGGMVASVLVALAVTAAAGGPVSLWAGVVAAGLSIVAQAGDLFESWLKRHVGVKDSGWLIPGHGGLFDRLDGLLAAAPAAAMLAAVAGRGMELWR